MKMVNYQLIPVNLKRKLPGKTGKASACFTLLKSLKPANDLAVITVPEQRQSAAEVKIGETNGRLEGNRDKVRFYRPIWGG